jgi:iron complex outermembrane receptor protein
MQWNVLRAVLAAAGVCALATAAQAQTTASQTEELAEITITGSRVIANGNDAPTPVTVMTPEQVLATKPTTLYDNLIDMPVFSGSRGASNGPVANSPTGQGAVSSLNLRNMGTQRNLVLFDGHRVPPATPDGVVDVNSLPQMLIQRVDVVTGGVSAVYGSDAITGVTNFITDSKFNGVRVDAQRGVSTYGDDPSYQYGIAAGVDLFSGRGHIEASYQRQNDQGLVDTQRAFTRPKWMVQGDGVTIPWHLQDNLKNATASYGGVITCPTGTPGAGTPTASRCPGRPLVGMSFNQNDFLSPYDAGAQGAAAGLSGTAVQIGGDGVIFTNVALKSRTRLDQVFTRFDFDFTDNIHGYIAGSGVENSVYGVQGVQRTFTPGWRVGACNAFLPSQYQTALGCTPANSGTAAEPFFWFNKAFDPALNFGAGQNNRLYTHNYFVLADLAGKFGDGYRWDGTYTHSRSSVNVHALNQDYGHIYPAVDAVIDPSTQQVVCRSTLTNPGLYPGCVPFNLFGPTSMTQAMTNYMYTTVENTTVNKLDGLAGSLTGAPLSSWAGPIDMALSGEYRRLTMDLASTSLPTDTLDCVGLRFGGVGAQGACNPGVTTRRVNGWLPISGAKQTVSEAAYELNLPLMKDQSLLKDLNFNGAARYTRYSNNPNNTTFVSRSFNATSWKAGLVWDLPGSVTLRWARSRDIRAPSLYELYQPATVGNATFTTDYLIAQPGSNAPAGGTQVAAAPKTGGNPLLDPEVAHTTTVGLVYRPTPQLSVALDAYRITLVKALYSLSGATQAIQQACYASGGTSPLCQLQERPFGCCSNNTIANALTAVYTRFVNIAQQRTAGIDLEANFSTRLLDRALSLRALGNYQPHISYVLPNAPVIYDSAGVAYPTVGAGLPAPIWKGSLFARYKLTDHWTVDLSERYRSRLHWTADPTQTQVGGVGSMVYTNVTVGYDMPLSTGQLNVFLNVQNLFNRQPPPAAQPGGTFPGGFPSGYAVGDDVVGRYFVLGAHMRL